MQLSRESSFALAFHDSLDDGYHKSPLNQISCAAGSTGVTIVHKGTGTVLSNGHNYYEGPKNSHSEQSSLCFHRGLCTTGR